MAQDDEKIDLKDTYSKLNNWVKKNIFTVIGIILILSIAWYDLATVQTSKVKVINECNLHWANQVRLTCPTLFENNVPNYNSNSFNISLD